LTRAGFNPALAAPRKLFAAASVAADNFDFAATAAVPAAFAVTDTAVFMAIIGLVSSVVVMSVLFTNIDNIINVMVMLMNDIVFMDFVMLVLYDMTMLENSSVIRAAEFPSVITPAVNISFTPHLKFPRFLNFFFVSIIFVLFR
jgi:hypothetical protein